MSVCHGLWERIQFLDVPALRISVQHRLCSISCCRSVLISIKTPTGRSAWWERGLNVHPALSNGCSPLCSLMVISNMRNIHQRQRGKVAQCTALPSASRGVGVTENWHFKGQAENPGKHTLLLAFSFVCHKNIPQPRDHSSFWLLNICYESLVIQLCMFFFSWSLPILPEKESWKNSSTHPGLLRQDFLN